MFLFLLICDIFIPLTMYFAGRMMKYNPPKTINGFYGYRTSMSRKNMDTWLFAHNHAGEIWMKVGKIMLIITLAIHIPLYFIDNDDILSVICLIMTAMQLITLILSVIPTEKALKENFNPDGSRK